MTKNDMKKDYIYSNAKLHYTLVPGNSDTPLVLIHGQCMSLPFMHWIVSLIDWKNPVGKI